MVWHSYLLVSPDFLRGILSILSYNYVEPKKLVRRRAEDISRLALYSGIPFTVHRSIYEYRFFLSKRTQPSSEALLGAAHRSSLRL